MISRKALILAFASGLLLVLAFPPLNVYPLAFIALVPLLISLQGKGPKGAFYLGLVSGFIYFLGTVYWVSHSMHVYGYVPIAATVFAVALLCFYLALYAGVFSFLFTYLRDRSHMPASIMAPILWVSLEFLRTHALTGFPWSVLGYTQYSFLTLIQIADITGIYGISFLVVAVNGMLFDMIDYKTEHVERPRAARRLFTGSIAFTAIIITLSLWYGVVQLSAGDSGRRIKVSIIQGNIPQDKKWDREFRHNVIQRYEELTKAANAGNPDLIVWPESALPFIFGYDKDLTEDIVDFQKQLGSYLLFGGVVRRGGNQERSRLTNSAVLLSPEGNVLSIYNKIHLVPFGEYVPLKKFLPFIDKLVVAVGDFVPGKEHVVMDTPFAKIGNLICYEIIFPGLARELVDHGANVLVTITNDAWFGPTSAPYQHFSMAVFRAVENRVSVVRAANTGISGFIDSGGRIMHESEIFVEASMTESVPLGKDKSIYTRVGDVFAWLCMAGSLLMIVIRIFQGRDVKKAAAG
jgi:apolipoprotein N-acyltransferase